jgi:hypothetical protein
LLFQTKKSVKNKNAKNHSQKSLLGVFGKREHINSTAEAEVKGTVYESPIVKNRKRILYPSKAMIERLGWRKLHFGEVGKV